MTLVAPPAVDFIGQCHAFREHPHLSADAIPVGGGALKGRLQPMSLPRGVVSQQGGRLAGVQNDDVDIAVIVQVIQSYPPAAEFDLHSLTAACRHVDKLSVADVHIEPVRLEIRASVIEQIHLVLDVTAGHEDVTIAIVFKVSEANSPGDISQRTHAGARREKRWGSRLNY